MTAPGFGDASYVSADPTGHVVGHPDALLSTLIGNVLQTAYFASQHNGRIVCQQGYAYNMQTPETALRAAGVQTGTGWLGLSETRRVLPKEITHLTASLHYAFPGFLDTQVTARIRVEDASANVDDDTSSVELLEQDEQAGQLYHLFARDQRATQATVDVSPYQSFAHFPHTNGFEPRTIACDVELVNVDPSNPGLCLVQTFVRVLGTIDGSTFVFPIITFPLGAFVWSEMRYE